MKNTGGAKRKGKSLCRPARAPTPASFTALESGCMWLYCLVVCVIDVMVCLMLRFRMRAFHSPATACRTYLVREADGDELADGLGLRRPQVLVVGQRLAPDACKIVCGPED